MAALMMSKKKGPGWRAAIPETRAAPTGAALRLTQSLLDHSVRPASPRLELLEPSRKPATLHVAPVTTVVPL